jgi:hypothetical protein
MARYNHTSINEIRRNRETGGTAAEETKIQERRKREPNAKETKRK